MRTRLTFLATLFAVLFTLFCTMKNAEAQTAPVPPCQPTPWGKGPTPLYQGKLADGGEWAYHYCADPYKPRLIMSLKQAGYQMKVPTITGLTVPQIYEAVWKLNVTTPLTDPSFKDLKAAVYQHIAANKTEPATPQWVVAKGTAADGKVPTYTRVEGPWKECAVEGGRCTTDKPMAIRYGSGSTWVTQMVWGSVDCKASNFGLATAPANATCDQLEYAEKGDATADRILPGGSCECSSPYGRVVTSSTTYCMAEVAADKWALAKCAKAPSAISTTTVSQ